MKLQSDLQDLLDQEEANNAAAAAQQLMSQPDQPQSADHHTFTYAQQTSEGKEIFVREISFRCQLWITISRLL